MSWDVKSGYRQFYLHPKMREYFIFHIEVAPKDLSRFHLVGEDRFNGSRS
jgi:hypothetical protein